MLAKKGTDEEVLARLGDTYLAANHGEEAIAVYERLLEIDADNPVAFVGLGRAHLRLFRPEAAGQYFTDALALTPEDAEIFGLLALAEDMSGDYPAAEVYYLKALELRPSDTALQNNLALSRLLAGDYDGATEVLRKIAFMEGATPQIRQNLALAYGLMGDEAAAARIARMDLDAAAVADNLRVYAALRRLAEPSRLRRYLMNPLEQETEGS